MSIEKFQKDINKKYGEGVMISARFLAEQKKKIIPISPSVDLSIGGGIPEGTWCIFSGPPKCGKEQPLSSKIYTPNGYITFNDVKIGTEVCTPDGKTSFVNGVFPQGKKDVYRVYFDNGDYMECGLEHLFYIKTRYEKEYNVRTLKEIKNTLKLSDGRPKWQIPTSICCFKNIPVKIDPYTFGVLLGDGSFRRKNSLMLTSSSKELINTCNISLPDGFYFKKKKTTKYDYTLNTNRQKNQLVDYIKSLGLWNKFSKEKFIPNEYKYNSIENRYKLIRGLLDTDGHINKRGNKVSFYSTSKQLCQDVKDIVQSLGGIAKVSIKNGRYKGEKHISYVCHIRFNDNRELFLLSSKLIRCKKRSKQILSRKIIDIELVRNEECRCISIESDKHLYITDNYLLTHNTTTALQLAANAQKLYSKKVCYVHAEGRLKPLNLNGVASLNLDDMYVIQSIKGKILTAEHFLQETMNFIKTEPESIVIIDSSSALCSEKELIEDITGQTRNIGPKLLASFCRQMGTIVPVQDTIVIIIQHLIANTSGYGAKYIEDGGQKIQYQMDTKLRCKGVERWANKDGDQIGQIINWEVVCSALGPPGKKCQSYLKYGLGLDNIMELQSLCIDAGLIDKGGAWYSLINLTNPEIDFDFTKKIQGEENLYNILCENPLVVEELEKRLKEILQ